MTRIPVPLFTDHAEEVRAIIQRAAKDVAIESSLKTYEEVWLSKIFELKAHTRMKGPSSATAATQDVSTQLDLTFFFLLSVCPAQAGFPESFEVGGFIVKVGGFAILERFSIESQK